MSFMGVPGPFELLFVFSIFVLPALAIFVVLPFWMITTKAVLIPLLNIVFLFFLALADWPALAKRLEPLDTRGPFRDEHSLATAG